jgi:Mg2+/Co2+ transporter CorB
LDNITTSTLLILLFFLIFISAYFSSSETAMMALNRYKLHHLARQNHQGAIQAKQLLKKPDRLISLILIGNNLVNILASSIATIIGLRWFGDLGIAIATVALTLIILIFAEVTPKTIAALYPEKLAFPSSYILKKLMLVLYPLIEIINFFSHRLLKLFNIPMHIKQEPLTQAELTSLVQETKTTLSGHHQQMLLSVLNIHEIHVQDIMTPRHEFKCLNLDDDIDQNIKKIGNSTSNQLIVYRNNVDNIVGLLRIQDVTKYLSKKQLLPATLQNMVRKPYCIPENTPLNVLLYNLQVQHESSAFVVDEYGDIQGFITLNDVTREMIGHPHAQHTELETHIRPQQDGSVVVDGRIFIRELNKEMHWQLPINGPKTLNGLILEYLEDLPMPKTSLRVGGYPMEIIEVNKHMIKSVRIIPNYVNKDAKLANSTNC